MFKFLKSAFLVGMTYVGLNCVIGAKSFFTLWNGNWSGDTFWVVVVRQMERPKNRHACIGRQCFSELFLHGLLVQAVTEKCLRSRRRYCTRPLITHQFCLAPSMLSSLSISLSFLGQTVRLFSLVCRSFPSSIHARARSACRVSITAFSAGEVQVS